MSAQVAILLFDGVVALDAVGPYDVLKLIPGADVRLVAIEAGEVRTDGPLRLVAAQSLDDVPRPDVVVVPGGPGSRAAAADERHLRWLRDAHAHSRWTSSVCSGADLLGAAGLLDGIEATTHWLIHSELAGHGAIAVDDVAQRIQLTLEYAPEPPFRAGSPHTAPDALVADMRAGFTT